MQNAPKQPHQQSLILHQHQQQHKQAIKTHSSYLHINKQNNDNSYLTMQMISRRENHSRNSGNVEDDRRGQESQECMNWMRINIEGHLDKNNRLSQRIVTRELLEIDVGDNYANVRERSNSRSMSRSKSKSKRRTKKQNGSSSNLRKTIYKQMQSNPKVNIIHGVYNRNITNTQPHQQQQKCQKQNNPTKQQIRNLSNFQLLKLQVEQLEKSNIVLGVKENNKQQHQHHRSSTKELSLKEHLPDQASTAHQHQHQPAQTRTQRYRYKYSMTNRNQIRNRSKFATSGNGNGVQFHNSHKSKAMDSTLTDMKSYYQHIQNQIHNRSTHKLSTQWQNNPQQTSISYNKQANHQPSTMSKHHKSASQWHINRKNSKKQEQQNSSSYIKTQYHVSHPMKSVTQCSVFIQSQQNGSEYLIKNQFIPLVNRSILDKNRNNIKKIGKNMNRILTSGGTRTSHAQTKSSISTNTNRRCNTVGDQAPTLSIAPKNNQNIEEFVKNKMSIIDLCAKAEKKSLVTMQSFYNKSLVDYSQIQNQIPITNTHTKNQTNSNKSISEAYLQGQAHHKNADKVISNAAKFYRPQMEKSKEKANVMVVDPHLKAKAIQINGKQTKKNNDIVIICL